MVADFQEHRQISEGLQLVLNEVRPCIGEILMIVDCRMGVEVILVESINGAIVAEVPIERHSVADGLLARLRASRCRRSSASRPTRRISRRYR